MTDSASLSMPRPMAKGGVVTLANGKTRELASLWSRLLARLLDAIVIGVVVTILFAFGFLGEAGNEAFEDAFVADGGQTWRVILVGLIYEVLMIAFLGRTVGKMIMRIKVVKVSNGHVPLLVKAFLRYVAIAGIWGLISRGGTLLATLATVANLLVFLSPRFNKARQGWHDMLATTVVIKTRSE